MDNISGHDFVFCEYEATTPLNGRTSFYSDDLWSQDSNIFVIRTDGKLFWDGDLTTFIGIRVKYHGKFHFYDDVDGKRVTYEASFKAGELEYVIEM